MPRLNAKEVGLSVGDRVSFIQHGNTPPSYVPGTTATLERDDGSTWPYFKTAEGHSIAMYLTDVSGSPLFTRVDATQESLSSLSSMTLTEMAALLDGYSVRQREITELQNALNIEQNLAHEALSFLLSKIGATTQPSISVSVPEQRSIGALIASGEFDFYNAEDRKVVVRGGSILGFDDGQMLVIRETDEGDTYPIRLGSDNDANWQNMENLQHVYFV